MVVVSLNYKKMPLELRGKFAFEDEKIKSFLSFLRSCGAEQVVFLSTCNRCEVYAAENAHALIFALSSFSKIEIETVKNYALIFEGEKAVKHLFSVCCGLDSMVVGEDEILGQVKRAVAFCKENGFLGSELASVFKAAVTSAKKIKTTTMLSKSSVSVATLAVSKCRKFSGGQKTVLILGASGEIGSKTLKNLLSYDEFEIFAAVRERRIAQKGVHIISYDERYAYADKADIIICATKSPHYIFTYERLSKAFKASKPRLLLDLAVPSDIDKDAAKIKNTQLLTIDDFEKIAKENSNLKEKEIVTAQEILNECVDEFCKETLFRNNLPLLKRVLSEEEMRFAYKFRDNADAKQTQAFIKVISKMEDSK